MANFRLLKVYSCALAIDVWAVKRNVPGGVARHVDDVKLQAQGVDLLTATQRCVGLGNRLGGWAVDLRAIGLAQGCYAADVVGVVVRD